MKLAITEVDKRERKPEDHRRYRWDRRGNRQVPAGIDWREYDKKPRLYVHPEGETLLENLENRWERRFDVYRTKLPEILKQAGLPSSTKAVWSQKAGCSCGCSPAFIIQTRGHFDVWATVKED